MKSITQTELAHLEALLNKAIDFKQFEKQDLLDLQAFVELNDVNHELRKALKKKINLAVRFKITGRDFEEPEEIKAP